MTFLLVEFIVLYVTFIGYSCFEGDREAYFFASASISGLSDKYNLHPLFVKQRIMVTLMALCCLPWILALMMLLAFMFTFSFFHNGSYHKKINDINPKVYPLRWKAASLNAIEMSKLSLYKRVAVILYMIFNERGQVAAALDFTYKTRVIQFAIGAAFFVCGILFIVIKF